MFKHWRDVVYRGAYLRAFMRKLLSARWLRVARGAFSAWRRVWRRAAAFEKPETASVRFHAVRASRSRVADGAQWRRRAPAAPARARLAEEEDNRRREESRGDGDGEASFLASELDAARAQNATLAAIVHDARAETSASPRADAEERRAEAETRRCARRPGRGARAHKSERRRLGGTGQTEAEGPGPGPGRAAANPNHRGVAFWEDFPPEKKFRPRRREHETPAPADAAASADGSPLSPPAMRARVHPRGARARRVAARRVAARRVAARRVARRRRGRFADEARDATRDEVDVVVDDDGEDLGDAFFVTG